MDDAAVRALLEKAYRGEVIANPPPSAPLAPSQLPEASPASPPAPPPATNPSTAPADISTIKLEDIERGRDTKHEISLSGDYFYGQGTVTLPFAFGLANAGNPDVTPDDREVGTPDRKSDYIGATLSYSFGQEWFLDLTYAHGESSGKFPIAFSGEESDFQIRDDWYQAYVRYSFKNLSSPKWDAYARAGVSFVQAELTDVLEGFYSQTDNTQDILGNVGFGAIYYLYKRERIRVGLQIEGEGFYGHRSQDTKEAYVGIGEGTASIENALYGGIGRATVRFQYAFGDSRLFKVFVDGGVQVRYTRIDYSDYDGKVGDGVVGNLGTLDELLWGPYIKLGFRYSF